MPGGAAAAGTPPQLITQVLLCKGGRCKQCLERSHCIPSWAQRPQALPCGSLPSSVPCRDEGQRVEGTESGFGEQLPLALPCSHVLGIGGPIFGEGGEAERLTEAESRGRQ